MMLGLSLSTPTTACLHRPRPAGGGAPIPPVPLTRLVAEGDSITANEVSYAERWAAANPGVAFINCTQGGSGIATMMDRLAATMAHDPSHLTILIGANDIGAGTVAADYVQSILAYVAAAKAIKPALIVGVCAVLPIDEDAEVNAPPAKYGFNVIARDVNALLRAAVGSGIDFLVPLGDAFSDADALDPALSDDGLHWMPPAYARMEAVYGAVMAPIAASSAHHAPGPFAFTDRPNAPAASIQTASVFVTGMALARTSSAMMNGSGDFRRGHGPSARRRCR